MKAGTLFLLIALIVICGCTQPKKSSLEGSWQMVYGKWMNGDTLLGDFPGQYKVNGIKMWSKGHFLFVGNFKGDTSSMDNYGGGTYKLDGDRYEETIQFHAYKSMEGSIVKMILEIRNDTLIQTWPVDANGQINKSFSREKYIRLD